MRYFFIPIWLTIFPSLVYAQNNGARTNTDFSLSYISIGLGSNMFDLQPAFRVKGTRFIHTSEQVWQLKNQEVAKPDTVRIGNLRISSIDSILNLAKQVKGDSVYKLNAGVMSGGIIYLDISSQNIKLHFRLDNSFDPIARKIIDILNTYIPDKYHRLWISDVIPTITETK